MMHKCPCCSQTLLRHVRHGSVYWFCTHCWQEMPDLEMGISSRKQRILSARIKELASPVAV